MQFDYRWYTVRTDYHPTCQFNWLYILYCVLTGSTALVDFRVRVNGLLADNSFTEAMSSWFYYFGFSEVMCMRGNMASIFTVGSGTCAFLRPVQGKVDKKHLTCLKPMNRTVLDFFCYKLHPDHHHGY